MPNDLEADIQSAWAKANTALRLTEQNKEEIVRLIGALRNCAARAGAIGFTTGELELLRMARFLEGRIAPSEFPHYGTCGSEPLATIA
jgi:hypothetical protein